MANHCIKDLSPIKPLKQLKYLNLAHNQISDIRPITSLFLLEELVLDYNSISSFPRVAFRFPRHFQDLYKLRNLKTMSLSHNKITYESFQDLLSLSVWPHLSSLSPPVSPIINAFLQSGPDARQGKPPRHCLLPLQPPPPLRAFQRHPHHDIILSRLLRPRLHRGSHRLRLQIAVLPHFPSPHAHHQRQKEPRRPPQTSQSLAIAAPNRRSLPLLAQRRRSREPSTGPSRGLSRGRCAPRLHRAAQ